MAKKRKIVRTKRIYKKRSTNKKALSMVLFILLILILVGLGFIVRKEWSKRFGPNAPQSSMPTSSAPSSSTPDSSDVSSEATSSQEQPNMLSGVKAIHMTADVLLQQKGDQYKSYLDKAKNEGYNAVYVELKSEDGIILFNTNNEMAKAYGTISENPTDITMLVSAIKQAGLTPIAQISVLKDARAPHVSNNNSYAFSTQLETNWLDDSFDRGGKPWLNPYMDDARKYVVDLSKEIIDAGFDSIVLNNVMFPDKNTGKMNVINQTKSYSEILKQLVNEVQTAIGTAKVYVSYSSESFIKTKESTYYVSAKDIGHTNVAIMINNADLNRVLNNTTLTAEQKAEATKKLLDQVVADLGKDASVITFVADDLLEKDIKATIDTFHFNNTIS